MPPFDPTTHPSLVDLGARLRELAGDSSYQAGRDYWRKGRVQQGAVAGTTAYATVAGSSEYRVSIAFGVGADQQAAQEADQVKVRCTCPAARRNKYCKHVVAVATALLERPGDFVIGEAPPEVQTPPKRAGSASPRTHIARTTGTTGKSAAKTSGKTAGPTPEVLRAAGLETVDRLLAELADGGLISLGKDKLALLAGAGDLVRALKLRRLGNVLLRLQRAAERGQRAGQGQPAIDERTFAHLLADLWLTRRATGASLAGDAQLDQQSAEDLLGKTWRDEELERTAGLDLMEVAYQRQDDGEFRIETSYLGDLATGTLYAERQITPIRLVSTAKSRHLHRLLVDEAGLYPGGAPRRLKLLRTRREPLHAGDVARFLSCLPESVDALRQQLVSQMAIPFGTPEVVVAFHPAALMTRQGAPAALDRDGRPLALECPPSWLERLPPLLPLAGNYALVGLLTLADDTAPGGLLLRCLSAVSPSFAWAHGPVFDQ
jgi:hypothetical protein